MGEHPGCQVERRRWLEVGNYSSVAAVCILPLVPYIFGFTLRCETIGACRRALVGLQMNATLSDGTINV